MSELNWIQPVLGEVAEVIDPHPSHRAPPEMDGGIPFVGIGDLTTSGEVLASSARKVSPAVLVEHKARYSVAPGDIAYGRVATVGKVMRFGEVTEPFALSPTMALIKPNGVSASYLAQYLQSKQWDDESAKLLTGTTRSSLGIQLLRKIRITCPQSSEEQTVIGRILDTLDTAIHETEAMVVKLKAVKQGLLHDLLTRGIDANGELRPPQFEAPHLYKLSPLGWIPKEWDLPQLLAVSTRITDGTHQAVTTVVEGGEVPFLFVSCVRDGEVAWEKAASITKQDYIRISKGREPAPGMVLYTAVGSYGHAADVGDASEFAFQRHIACIYPDAAKVVAGFMSLVLNWEPMRRYADRMALGNAQKTVTLGELSQFPFVCPKKAEQLEIIHRMRAAQEKLTSEQRYLEKLHLQKSGLMNDLLTGHIRVTPLCAEAAQQQRSA